MQPELQIGNYVTLRGKKIKPGRIIDIKGWRATIGWKVKYGNQQLLPTKTVSLNSLELFIPIKKPNVISRFFNSIFSKS